MSKGRSSFLSDCSVMWQYTHFYQFFLLLCFGLLPSCLWSAVISHYTSHPWRMSPLQLHSRPLECYVNSYMKTSNTRGETVKWQRNSCQLSVVTELG